MNADDHAESVNLVAHVYGHTFRGHDGLRTMLSGAPGGLHLGGPAAIGSIDGDQATAMQNLLFIDPTSGEQRAALYDDRLVRTPDGWRIAARRCRFITPAASLTAPTPRSVTT